MIPAFGPLDAAVAAGADELPVAPTRAAVDARRLELRRIDVALDVVLDILARLLAEVYRKRLDPSTQVQAHGALTRLYIALGGRLERYSAMNQAAALLPGKPAPSPEDVARWMDGWERYQEEGLYPNEPPSCLAGPVTTRKDVAPLLGGTCDGPPCTCGALAIVPATPPVESLHALRARVDRLGQRRREQTDAALGDHYVAGGVDALSATCRQLAAASAELARREAEPVVSAVAGGGRVVMSAHEQCPSQWEHAGCGRPKGHAGIHVSADRMSGWCDGAGGERRGPWTVCGDKHPTADFSCYAVKGHAGPHYALTVPMPEGEPTVLERRPFVEWKTPRARKAVSP